MFADLYIRSLSYHRKYASGFWLKMLILSEHRIFLNACNWRLHHYPQPQPYLYACRWQKRSLEVRLCRLPRSYLFRKIWTCSSDGVHQHLKGELVMAVTFTLRQISSRNMQVPYIRVHKRDYISHFEDQSCFKLLNLNSLGQKCKSLIERQKALATSYERLQVKDEY